ncbi:SRPBCC domain-containing protein [Streptomyces sp. NPDC059373]
MAQQTVTTTDNDFTITRTFPAPLATVWATWTDPAHFQQWFHAKPGSVELEVRARRPVEGGPGDPGRRDGHVGRLP